eukprot:TRINITY_DN1467_c0_g1_i1.p1 TRINITY_DN1467_c0_g1~~TRINITY_DN1467_c0_g1_i1.p1  ORF type:complete len:1398 (+),score=458.35 TRINITY_DN1467_c0_g1_i1:68-4261(+)
MIFRALVSVLLFHCIVLSKSQCSTEEDFSIQYNGVAPAFTVSRQNYSCTCPAGFVGGPSQLSSLSVSAPLDADGRALRGLLLNPDIVALINRQQAEIAELRALLESYGGGSGGGGSSGGGSYPVPSRMYQSCSEILANDPSSGDGVYTLYPRLNPQAPVSVYCDMTTDGGGWALIGRVSDTNGVADLEFATASNGHSIIELDFNLNTIYSPQYVLGLGNVLPPTTTRIDLQYYCYSTNNPIATAYWVKVVGLDAARFVASMSAPDPDFAYLDVTTVNKDNVWINGTSTFSFFTRSTAQSGLFCDGNWGNGQSGVKPTCSGNTQMGQLVMNPKSVWFITHGPSFTGISSCGSAAGVLPWYRGEVRFRLSSDQPIGNGTAPSSIKMYRTCDEVLSAGASTGSGVYVLYPTMVASAPVSVYCDMTTDGGGWEVVARVSDTNGIIGDKEFSIASPSVSLLDAAVGLASGQPLSAQHRQPLGTVIPSGMARIDLQYYCYSSKNRANTAFWVKLYNVSVGTLITGLSSPNPGFVLQPLKAMNQDGDFMDNGAYSFFVRGAGNAVTCGGNTGGGQSGVKANCDGSVNLGQQVMTPRSVWFMTHQSAGGYTEVTSCGGVGGDALPWYVGEVRFRPSTSPRAASSDSLRRSAPTRMYRTCREIIENNASIGTGYYTVYPFLNPSESVFVYCDMETNGGGWQLVARASDTNGAADREFAALNRGMLDVSSTVNTPYLPQFGQALGTVFPSFMTNVDFQYYCYNYRDPIDSSYWSRVLSIPVDQFFKSMTTPNPDFVWVNLTGLNKDGVWQNGTATFSVMGKGTAGSATCNGNYQSGQTGMKPTCSGATPNGNTVMSPRGVWYVPNPVPTTWTEVTSCGSVAGNLLAYYRGEIRFRPSGPLPNLHSSLVAAPPRMYRSCAEILANNASLGDGTYVVYPTLHPWAGQSVYCDMTTDNGGWTLVSRASETNGVFNDNEFSAASGYTVSMLDLYRSINNAYAQQFVRPLFAVLPSGASLFELQYVCYQTTNLAATYFWIKGVNFSIPNFVTNMNFDNPDFMMNSIIAVNKDGITQNAASFAFLRRGTTQTVVCNGNYGGNQNGFKPSCGGTDQQGQKVMSPRSVWFMIGEPNFSELNSCGATGGTQLPYFRGEIRVRPLLPAGTATPAEARLYRSCAEYMANNASHGDGLYTVHPTLNAAAPLTVWCDMTTDGGGWTLIARASDTNGIADTTSEFGTYVGAHSILDLSFSTGTVFGPQYLLAFNSVVPPTQTTLELQYYCFQSTNPSTTSYWVKGVNMSVATLRTNLAPANPDFLMNVTMVNKDGHVTYGAGFALTARGIGQGTVNCGNYNHGQSGFKATCGSGAVAGQAPLSPRSVWFSPNGLSGLTEVNSCGSVGNSVMAYYQGEVRFR